VINVVRGAALTALMLTLGTGVPPSAAQAPPPVALVVVNVQAVALGYRVSQLIGRQVSNGKEDIGKIDDFIIGRDKVLFVIIGVGGFLGIGQKLVAAPYNRLTVTAQRIVLPGATKEALRRLPEFKYAL
jgi:hypothetical protein